MKNCLVADLGKYADYRVAFQPHFQKQLINMTCEKMRMNLKKLVDCCLTRSGLSYSAWKKFRREEILMPLREIAMLCNVGNIGLNKVLTNAQELRAPNWGSRKGGKLGISAVIKKYGEMELQRRRANGAKKRKGTELAKLSREPLLDIGFAEFVGAHLGDGTMTKDFIRISGDAEYDEPYLRGYLSPLVSKIFGVQAKCYFDRNTFNVKVSSRALCRYLFREWGIPYGDKIKHEAKIPQAILENRELFMACLRGLVDTDGSVSKDGPTISIKFNSSNPSLLGSIAEGLNIHKLNFFTFAYTQCFGTHSTEMVREYFRIIGSSNLKHVIKFSEWYVHARLIRTRDTLSYFRGYCTIPLPFYYGTTNVESGPWSSG